MPGYSPFPLGDSKEEQRQQLKELLRALFEDSIGGLQLGDVFTDLNDVLALKLDGTSLQKTATGLKVSQSSHINDPSGGATVDTQARTAINAILDLLTERGLMA